MKRVAVVIIHYHEHNHHHEHQQEHQLCDYHCTQAVAKNAEHAEHYRNAMRAVEEQAWRGIVDSYSFAWRSAQPGFLRALQVCAIHIVLHTWTTDVNKNTPTPNTVIPSASSAGHGS